MTRKKHETGGSQKIGKMGKREQFGNARGGGKWQVFGETRLRGAVNPAKGWGVGRSLVADATGDFAGEINGSKSNSRRRDASL